MSKYPPTTPTFVPVLRYISPLEALENAPLGAWGMPAIFYCEKYCNRCGETKHVDEFVRRSDRRYGIGSWCLECNAQRQRGYAPKPETKWRKGYLSRCREYGVHPVVEEFTRDDLIARDGERCAECGDATAALELDHVVPVAAGGAHTLGNTRLVDAVCNRRKARTEDPALIAAYREEVAG